MSEWDPWKRLERERERRLWDPLARLEYERDRLSWDPYYRMEKEMADPFYRLEKQREREFWDPMYRYERERERMREDSWYRELHRIEHGLRPDQVADPVYVQEKETGLGTRPSDWYNPEYRVHMDEIKHREEERRIRESSEFMQRFFDPDWLTKEEIERQLRELEEKERRRREAEAMSMRKSGGIFGFFRRLFGLF